MSRVHAHPINNRDNVLTNCEYNYYTCNNNASRLIERNFVINDSTHARICENCYQLMRITIASARNV